MKMAGWIDQAPGGYPRFNEQSPGRIDWAGIRLGWNSVPIDLWRKAECSEGAIQMTESAVRLTRVLAIDDSPEFLSSLQSFFATIPDFYLVGTAQSGSEALALVQKLQPDLVLMDLQMPGMNGLETTLEIRRHFPGLAVVIVTAHELPGLRQACHENGACDFVKKSRLYQDLPDVLAEFLISRAD
jgi:CheY-like chemotaxis protein